MFESWLMAELKSIAQKKQVSYVPQINCRKDHVDGVTESCTLSPVS